MIDLQKELADALVVRENLRDSYNKNEGAISFIQYQIEKEKECSQEISSTPSSPDKLPPA